MSKSVSSNSSVNSYSKDFSATELAEIKEAFAMFDIDGGGTWCLEHGIRWFRHVDDCLADQLVLQSVKIIPSRVSVLLIRVNDLILTTWRRVLSMHSLRISGTIESHELKLVLANLGEIVTDEELEQMIKKLDKDGDGEIDFEEFVGLMKRRAKERNERDPEEELRDAFNIFDADGSGFIDRNEVRLLMKKLAQDLTDEGENCILLYCVNNTMMGLCRNTVMLTFYFLKQKLTPSCRKLMSMVTGRFHGKSLKQSCFARVPIFRKAGATIATTLHYITTGQSITSHCLRWKQS